MSTTTIRVDTDTHAQLVAMSKASGASLLETVREAAEALRRQRFARRVAEELIELARNPDDWDDYVAEAESSSVADGVGR